MENRREKTKKSRKYFSAITGHIWFDTVGRAAVAVHYAGSTSLVAFMSAIGVVLNINKQSKK